MKLSVILAVCLLSTPSTLTHAGEVLRLLGGDIKTNPVDVQSLDFFQAESKLAASIIQFHHPITESDRQVLTQKGLRIQRYIPDDALIVYGPQATTREIALTLPSVHAVLPMSTEWKISPALAQEKGSIFISATLFDETDMYATAGQLTKIPAVKIWSMSGKTIVLEAPAHSVKTLAEQQTIEWVEALPVLETFDFKVEPAQKRALLAPVITGYESGTKIIGFEAVWARGYFGAGQTAAMADTGLDTGTLATVHPDLKNTIKGIAAGLGATSWEDPQAHGTHVAGSVIGNGTASNGSIEGGATQAKFVAVGMWSPIMGNIMPGSDFEPIMGAPYRDGARIHTNSWGAPMSMGAYDAMAIKADEIMWKYPDMLVLFAAGNSGDDGNQDGRIDEGSVSSPGTAKNVLTVGASENLLDQGGIQKTHGELRDGEKKWGVEPLRSDRLSNNPEGLAVFSSRGPTRDGRIKPEIVAPGTNIVSTRSKHPKATILWGEFGKDYLYAGGTSMATPLTAGAATVLRGYLADARGIQNPSGALVKAALLHTAKDLFPGQYGTGPKQELPKARPNVHEGYGRVDINQATSLPADAVIVDQRTGVGLNETQEYMLTLSQGEGLRATLSYTDAPGSASAAKALVNDLDLQVIMPNGQTRELSDKTNNTEMLELAGLAAGTYKIRVRGTNVPQGKNGKQPYALVVNRL